MSQKNFVTSKTIHEVQILCGLMAKIEKKNLNDIYSSNPKGEQGAQKRVV